MSLERNARNLAFQEVVESRLKSLDEGLAAVQGRLSNLEKDVAAARRSLHSIEETAHRLLRSALALGGLLASLGVLLFAFPWCHPPRPGTCFPTATPKTSLSASTPPPVTPSPSSTPSPTTTPQDEARRQTFWVADPRFDFAKSQCAGIASFTMRDSNGSPVETAEAGTFIDYLWKHAEGGLIAVYGGHDHVPVRTRPELDSNFDLAFRRAVAIADHLRRCVPSQWALIPIAGSVPPAGVLDGIDDDERRRAVLIVTPRGPST